MAGRIRFSGLFVGRFLPVHAHGRRRVRPHRHGRAAGGAGHGVALARAAAPGAVACAAPALAADLAGRGGQLGHSVRLVFLGRHAHRHRADVDPERHGAAVWRTGGLAAGWATASTGCAGWAWRWASWAWRLLAWRAPAGVGVKSDPSGLGHRWRCLPASCLLRQWRPAMRGARLTGIPPLATATGSQLGAALVLALPTLWFWPATTPGSARLGRHRRPLPCCAQAWPTSCTFA